jgi:hypothetical protein
MRVKNLNGTSDNPKCPCGTWLKHWENHTGLPAISCSVSDCIGDADVGAHVQLKDGNDNAWYIIPLCNKHNGKHGQELIIGNHIPPVPAVKRDKCGN